MIAFLLFLGGASIVFIAAYFLKSYKQNTDVLSQELLISNPIELAYLHKGIKHAYKVFLMSLISRGYLQPSTRKTKFRFNNVDYKLDNTSPYSDVVHAVMKNKCSRGMNEFERLDLVEGKDFSDSLASTLEEFHDQLEKKGLIIPSAIGNNLHYYKFLGVLILITIAGYSLFLSSSFYICLLILIGSYSLCYLLISYVGVEWLSAKGEEEVERIVRQYELLDDKTDMDIYTMFLASTSEEVLYRKFTYLYD